MGSPPFCWYFSWAFGWKGWVYKRSWLGANLVRYLTMEAARFSGSFCTTGKRMYFELSRVVVLCKLSLCVLSTVSIIHTYSCPPHECPTGNLPFWIFATCSSVCSEFPRIPRWIPQPKRIFIWCCSGTDSSNVDNFTICIDASSRRRFLFDWAYPRWPYWRRRSSKREDMKGPSWPEELKSSILSCQRYCCWQVEKKVRRRWLCVMGWYHGSCWLCLLVLFFFVIACQVTRDLLAMATFSFVTSPASTEKIRGISTSSPAISMNLQGTSNIPHASGLVERQST